MTSSIAESAVEDGILTSTYLTGDSLWWMDVYAHNVVPVMTTLIRKNALPDMEVGDVRQFAVYGQIHIFGSLESLLQKLGELANKYDDVQITRSGLENVYMYSGWSDLEVGQQLTAKQYMKNGENITLESILDPLPFRNWDAYRLWMNDGTQQVVRVSKNKIEMKIRKTRSLNIYGSLDQTLAQLVTLKVALLEKDGILGKVDSTKGLLLVTYWELISLNAYTNMQALCRQQRKV